MLKLTTRDFLRTAYLEELAIASPAVFGSLVHLQSNTENIGKPMTKCDFLGEFENK